MKKRFNVIDAILVILIVAAIAASLVFLRSRKPETTEVTTPIDFALECRAVSGELIACVENAGVGSTLYSSVDSSYLGKIVDIWYEPYVEYQYSANVGDYVTYELENRYDLVLTICGDGVENEKSFTVAETLMKIGQRVNVKGKGYALSGNVVDLNHGVSTVEDHAVGSGAQEFRYKVQINDVRDLTTNNLHVGDHFYDITTGALMGEVVDIDVQPYTVTVLGAQGDVLKLEKPGRYKVTMTLSARGTENDTAYFIDGKVELKVGAGMTARSKFMQNDFSIIELVSVTEAAK